MQGRAVARGDLLLRVVENGQVVAEGFLVLRIAPDSFVEPVDGIGKLGLLGIVQLVQGHGAEMLEL